DPPVRVPGVVRRVAGEVPDHGADVRADGPRPAGMDRGPVAVRTGLGSPVALGDASCRPADRVPPLVLVLGGFPPGSHDHRVRALLLLVGGSRGEMGSYGPDREPGKRVPGVP